MSVSFSLGHIAITPGALAALQQHGVAPATLLDRHVRGDWGEIDEEDQGLNEQALVTGDRLLSVYAIAIICSPLHDLLERYTQAYINEVVQGVVCSRLHAIAQRCARWLLLTHDRVDADQFPLTQQFLARMLGVRRASVGTVAGTLRKAGLIRYSRGVITILDRPGLEAAACECYRIIEAEYDRLRG
jgi:hypothetical protein